MVSCCKEQLLYQLPRSIWWKLMQLYLSIKSINSYCLAAMQRDCSEVVSTALQNKWTGWVMQQHTLNISDHHSSAVLHIIMWWWWAIVLLCGQELINGYFPTLIYKTYNPFRAEEATLLFTVLHILYTVRCYLLTHMVHYHAITTN